MSWNIFGIMIPGLLPPLISVSIHLTPAMRAVVILPFSLVHGQTAGIMTTRDWSRFSKHLPDFAPRLAA